MGFPLLEGAEPTQELTLKVEVSATLHNPILQSHLLGPKTGCKENSIYFFLSLNWLVGFFSQNILGKKILGMGSGRGTVDAKGNC